jgi:UDP-N-acetylmuramoyl-tripeptide--D-alanyl-D-alanine ligase
MLNLNDLLKIQHKEYLGSFQEGQELTFYTDTRSHNNENVFIAIEGERFKPLEFIEKIPEDVLIVCEENVKNQSIIKNNQKRNFLVVKDSVKALAEIGALISEKFQEQGGKVIAISGSNGKTTTKEMLYHLLKDVDQTVCTQKNNNNHIGVPLTLFQIKNDTKFCVVELGSNHPGEIKFLVDLLKPGVGVCTNIGETHLEFFENLENVFKEESYLIKYLLENNKPAFVNCDDDFLEAYKDNSNSICYGKTADEQYIFHIMPDDLFVLTSNKKIKLANTNLTGEHNIFNMMLAMSICLELGISQKKIEKNASSFKPTSNRSQWIEINKVKVFLDAYNANPSSMRAAIMGFKDECLKKNLSKDQFALVLGDMNELGDNSAKYHYELGKYCAESGFLNLYFVGRYAHDYNKGCNYLGTEFLDTEQLKAKIKTILPMYKAVLIKGSRSLQLESAVDITLC